MKLSASDIIAAVSAALATIALFIGIYAAIVTQRVATSGFQSAEKVKSDTACLLAALRGIMIKAAVYSQQDPATRNDEKRTDHIDIHSEQIVIQTFLNSPTAIAYYAFVADRSKVARESGKEGEDWRVFFLLLVELLHADNTYSAGMTAARIEKMFDVVSDKDIERMSSNLEDLVKSIKGIALDRQNDTLIHVLVDKNVEDKPDFKDFVIFLREQNIKDPDVDLFWSAIDGNVKLAEDAISRGAKLNTTEGEIKARYNDQWNKFKAQSIKN